MKKMDVAVLYTKMRIDDGFNLMIPFRVVLGNVDEKAYTFTDLFSTQVYVNSDLVVDDSAPYSFNMVVPLKDLKKKYGSSSDLVACQRYFDEIKKRAFFYKDTYVMNSMPLDEFHETYGLSVTYSDTEKLKEQMRKILDGEIEPLKDEEVEKEELKHVKLSITDYRISEVVNKVKETVIAQDEAVRQIVTAIYRNYMFDDPKMKSNVFVYGPTGVGKTEIVRTIGKLFDIPVLVEDMTRYTSAGYKGADLDDILVKLYYNANEDLDVAERSILVLDEIDKKAAGDSQSSFQKDDVLKSLLKIIEGGVFDIELDSKEVINFDTSKLTVITCGAFSDLYEKTSRKQIGFAKEEEKKPDKVELEAFTKYGIPVEFIGRMDTIVGLNKLSKDDFVRILKESLKSPIRIYMENLAKIGVNVSFNEEIYDSIATKAITKYDTGARALKVIVDEMFQEILYGIFDSKEGIESLSVSKETVDDNKVYKLTKKKAKEVEVSE